MLEVICFSLDISSSIYTKRKLTSSCYVLYVVYDSNRYQIYTDDFFFGNIS